jgi:hypothetical protein
MYADCPRNSLRTLHSARTVSSCTLPLLSAALVGVFLLRPRYADPPGLYELWRTGKYKNYPPNALVDIVARIMALVPPWTRVYRVQR